MGGANGSRECAPDDKLRDTHRLHLMEMMGFAGSTHPTCCLTHTDRFARRNNRHHGRFEDFRQQLSAIIHWHPPNVIDCRRSVREGSTIRLSSCVGCIMAWRVCLVAGLSSALLSGCASVGNESIADATSESVSAQMVKGKTNQENVRGLYGDPTKTSFTDSGNEIWEYDFSRMHSKPTNFIPYVNLIHSGAEGDKKSLVIFFDRTKVVRQYTISSSKVDVSQGLITR